MKLSEAIRKGSAGREQTFDGWYYDHSHHNRVCAMGAAAIAVGYEPGHIGIIRYLRQYFANALDRPQLMDALVFMNDTERKSFEEIAQWLEDQGL